MRELVAVCAILGGLIEVLAAVGGPQMAGVGMVTNERAPAMQMGPLLVGLAVGALSIVGGSLVAAGRAPRRWGVTIGVAAAIGAYVVGPSTGWFTLGAGFSLLGGVLALFVRPRRLAPGVRR